ncbi:MAG: transglutaminase domain-containing protein [Spirochaetaceae bacterium]|jgi:transglutaminase-like putative cysteine protease|nr:transglutaminase domain-containing protein [Spirochaetaceae bacterium]
MTRPERGTALFVCRLLLYLGVFSLPLIHPGISVAYDRGGMILWFFVLPLEALIAFFLGPSRLKTPYRLALAGGVLLGGAFFGAGFSPDALPFLGIGALGFLLTAALFRFPRWGRLVIFEQVLFAFICFRMLGFSRSSEEAAQAASSLTQGILIFTIAAFLLQGMVVYFSLFRQPAGEAGAGGENRGSGGPGRRKKGREFAVFVLAAGTAAILLLLVLPPDFVKNSVISNLLQDEVNPDPIPLDEDGDGIPDGNLRSQRESRRFPSRRGDREGPGSSPRLEGIPESRWPGQGFDPSAEQGDGSGEGGKQYAVMVVAAKTDPVYAGGSYRSELDPLLGFLPTEDEILNQLPTLRLLETWINTEALFDRGRSPEDIFVLSTLPEKYLPYRPRAVEPTVLRRGSGPFRYSYQVQSDMSTSGPQEWARVRDMTESERAFYRYYLDAALGEADRAVFEAQLRDALEGLEGRGGPPGYFGRIFAILDSFSDFQYNLGFTEDSSIPALVDFLTRTKEGDCTEFSNAAAVLGRLAGIPSRVVTGFLASRDLQTPAHIRGLSVLRNQIRLLQDFPPEDLYLVTTAHRHSWVQFWLPEYGWLDFEATGFAIPPSGMGDPNNRDVVIPLIEEEPEFMPLRRFPWKSVLRFLGFAAAAALLCAYALRYGREFLLRRRARRHDLRGIQALYRLLLMRLAAEGLPLKPPAKTSREYAALFSEESGFPLVSGFPQESGAPPENAFASFAALYTELRYRDFSPEQAAEKAARHEALREAAGGILKNLRRPGLRGLLRRIFSLRGLTYL